MSTSEGNCEAIGEFEASLVCMVPGQLRLCRETLSSERKRWGQLRGWTLPGKQPEGGPGCWVSGTCMPSLRAEIGWATCPLLSPSVRTLSGLVPACPPTKVVPCESRSQCRWQRAQQNWPTPVVPTWENNPRPLQPAKYSRAPGEKPHWQHSDQGTF